MFQVPGVSGILNPGGRSRNKIKGTVVLMRKNVLDFNSVADLTKGNIGGVIGTGLSIAGSTIDGLTAFLGRSVSLQLISATKSDGFLLPFNFFHLHLYEKLSYFVN